MVLFVCGEAKKVIVLTTLICQRPSKPLECAAISHTPYRSVIAQRGSLKRHLLSVSCQSSLPHLSARCRATAPERPRIPLNDSSAQQATFAADKFGNIPFSLICLHCFSLGLKSYPCVSARSHSTAL